MRHSLLRILPIVTTVVLTACVASPERSSSTDRLDPVTRTHLEFARDFENAGNDTMAQHHVEQAQRVEQERAEKDCGLLCAAAGAAVEAAVGPEPAVSCRDPATSPPSAPTRC